MGTSFGFCSGISFKLLSTSGSFTQSFRLDGLTTPPHHQPDLLSINNGVHHSMNFFQCCSSTNCFHWLTLFLSVSDLGLTSRCLGLTIWATPLSIKNLNSRVGIVQRKISWNSSWKRYFMLSYNVLSSIACSSQKLSIMFSTHSDKFVLPPFVSLCNNCRFFSLLMNSFLEIFQTLVGYSRGISHEFQ